MKVSALDVRRASGRIAALGLVCLPLLGGASAPADTSAAVAQVLPMASDLLEIKFAEGQEIRLRDGRPVDLRGRALTGAATSRVFELVARGEWFRSHDVSEEKLEAMRAQGRLAAGEELPDLNLYFRLRLPRGLDAKTIAEQLRTLPEVEAVYHVPTPAPAPVAPDYYTPSSGSYQRYQDAAPGGIDSRYAATLPGGQGTNVRICDVEYSFNSSHVDLAGVTVVGTTPADPFSNTNHGTAVMGVYGGAANGQGVTGIAPGAQKYFAAAQTTAGFNVGAAITSCAANISAGDIILIEQQTWGPQSTGSSDCYGCVPVEWYKPYYDAIKTAVAANKIVVETAGNGSQNLDDAVYSTGNSGHYPFLAQNDSGAILVGAGLSSGWGTTARYAHTYSNHGSTLDLQGWGDSIVTSGYGDLFSADGVNGWYTGSFGGTSGAGPIVTGAAASLQGRHKALLGYSLTPAQLKAVLRNTGTPYGGTKNIGPLPNLRAAFNSLSAPGACTAGGVSIAGGCWYLGGFDQSCQDVCASRGGYSSLTASYVGAPSQGGSVSNCQQVLTALGYPGAVTAVTRSDSLALGCHRWSTGALYWQTSPVFDPASKSYGNAAQLACACMN
ncbi:S8 family serine peptidase [Archangium lansingense]|uniref:S8 family serine peptidase n=1 Tax=Archangium lansingense TaxID=2995310 RepID=UPI003B7DD653